MRNEFAEFIKNKIDQDANLSGKIVLLTGDLGFSVLEPLSEMLGPFSFHAYS